MEVFNQNNTMCSGYKLAFHYKLLWSCFHILNELLLITGLVSLHPSSLKYYFFFHFVVVVVEFKHI